MLERGRGEAPPTAPCTSTRRTAPNYPFLMFTLGPHYRGTPVTINVVRGFILTL